MGFQRHLNVISRGFAISLGFAITFASGCFEETTSTSSSVVSAAKGRISAVLPKSGTIDGNIQVTITGENLNDASTATFGSTACSSLAVVSSKKITCVTPAGSAGSVDVVLEFNSGNASTLSSGYKYLGPAPELSSISPSIGSVRGGTTVTLAGANFDSSTAVTIGGTAAASVALTSSSTLVVVTPVGSAGSATVLVSQGDGQFAALASAFRYVTGPSISSVSPSNGTVSGGGTLVINGGGFDDSAAVTVGGNTCTGARVISASRLECTIPASTSTGAKTILVSTDSAVTATLSEGYTYYQSLSISPTLKQVSVARAACSSCASVTFFGSGGVPPYSYSLVTSALASSSLAATSNTVNSSTGIYTIAAAATVSVTPPTGTATIRVADTVGNTADTQIYILAAVTLSAPAYEIGPTTTTGSISPASSTLILTASNGVAPYSFSVTAGSGSVSGSSSTGVATYTATTYPITSDVSVTVAVTDSYGGTSSVGLSLRAPARFTALYKAAGTGTNTSDRAAGDAMGTSVAMTDEYLVIGAPNNDTTPYNVADAANAGAVYIYRRVLTLSPPSWTFEQKLRGAGPESNVPNGSVAADKFGTAVAVSGTLIAVGAPYQSYDSGGGTSVANSGAVFVFARTSSDCTTLCWAFEQKLVPSGTNARVAGDLFGSSVALSGNVLVAGAPNQDTDDSGANSTDGAGAAFIFNRNSGSWSQAQKLVAQGVNARKASDGFGTAVATDGSRILVGAPLHSYGASGAESAASAGAAFMYVYGSGVWSQQAKLVAQTTTASAKFGSSVAVSSLLAAVGAPGDTVSGNADTGSVGIFSLSSTGNWTLSSTLYSSLSYSSGTSDGAASAKFGTAVALSGDYLAVGAPGQGTDYQGANSTATAGAVYTYKKASSASSTWNIRGKFTGVGTNGRVAADTLGTSVGISSSGLSCGGAPGQDYDSSGANALGDAGAAWVFY